MVPLNKTGSWGIIEMEDRNEFNPTSEMSIPSIDTDPESTSLKRSKILNSELQK